MLERLQQEEALIKEYRRINDSFSKTLIYHVGTEAGLFSELNNMLIAVCYCYVKKIRFVLYADDANFSGEKGWEDLFLPFCECNHDSLNRYGNYRHRHHYRYKRVLLPHLLIRKVLAPAWLKRRTQADYLTQDIFGLITSEEVLKHPIHWDLFGMHGVIGDEFVKLRHLCLRYQPETEEAVRRKRDGLGLPRRYSSIQIRGGDKLAEYTSLFGAEYCMKAVRRETEDLFLFTDDYRHVREAGKYFQGRIYTLTEEREEGYYNEAFQQLPWEQKKEQLWKLLAMMEISMASEVHYGYSGSCTDDFLSKVRKKESYVDLKTNRNLRKKNMEYYLRKLFKFR